MKQISSFCILLLLFIGSFFAVGAENSKGEKGIGFFSPTHPIDN